MRGGGGGGLLTLPAENTVERLTAAGWLDDEPATAEDLNGGKEVSAECTEQLATGEDEIEVCRAGTGWRAGDELLIGEDLKICCCRTGCRCGI